MKTEETDVVIDGIEAEPVARMSPPRVTYLPSASVPSVQSDFLGYVNLVTGLSASGLYLISCFSIWKFPRTSSTFT